MLDLYIACLAETESRARRDLETFRQQVARAPNEKLHLLYTLGQIILDPEVVDEQVRASIYQTISQPELEQALHECEQIIRPKDDNYLDFLGQRYSYIRQFAPRFLETCHFQSHLSGYDLLTALEILRHLNRNNQRKIPLTAPTAFVPGRWYPYVVQDGQPQRRYYELCALWQVRHDLRAGNLWVTDSRRYADPETYLIDRTQWLHLRPEVCQLLQVPPDGQARLTERQHDLETLALELDESLTRSSPVRLEQGRLIVPPVLAEALPERVVRLQTEISDRLPQLDLVELIMEVDRWVHFSACFEHAGDHRTPETSGRQTELYATIMAQACNFGLEQMAAVADLPYTCTACRRTCPRLAWCNNWYLREETLQAAITVLVNFHYQQPLAQHWGGGTLSSSDGQRFPVTVSTHNATALPRYFGYGRGLTFYTWTSDQFSQYGSQVIPATMRDATYTCTACRRTCVLDAILDNETELDILEHTTDTAGYTELIFALFDLLGLQFAPRIRDIGDQHLYRIDRTVTYRHLDPVFTRILRCDRIVQHWDDLLRVAGLLKLGWVTASLLVGKLQAYSRQNALTVALQEYGRLIKTIFILRYLHHETLRRRINRQLNKGEALHALRRFLFFANLGKIRRRAVEEQVNQASCLNLVTNAVIIWNTVYMQAVLSQLEQEGMDIQAEDMMHLAPTRYTHINPYGRYHFQLADYLSPEQLRPLRQPR